MFYDHYLPTDLLRLDFFPWKDSAKFYAYKNQFLVAFFLTDYKFLPYEALN